jgi:hypothetical protein
MTDGLVGRGRPAARTAICSKAAVERSRMTFIASCPTAVWNTACPSCTPYGRRWRFPSAGRTGGPSLGNNVRAVASTPGSPARWSAGAPSLASTSTGRPTPLSSEAFRRVGPRPLELNHSLSGPLA